jgi:uncharacterized protein (DUF885 family)
MASPSSDKQSSNRPRGASRALSSLLTAALVLGLGLAARSAGASDGGDAGAALERLFQDAWQWQLEDNPLMASATGDNRFDDRLPDLSKSAIEQRAAKRREWLARLAKIDRAQLDPTDQVSYGLFQGQVKADLAEHDFGLWRMPLTAEGGFYNELARMADSMRFETAADYERYLARLQAVPRYFEQQTALLEEGLAAGLTPPKAVLTGFEGTVTTHIVDDPTKSAYYKPFATFPPTVFEADRARLAMAGRQVIAEIVVPAYRRLLTFMTGRYLPGVRTTVGASELPRGRELYAHLVRYYTTLDVTPRQVHDLGLKEVARIRAEMEQIIRDTGFRGSFAEFLQFLRTDPRFYPKTAEELMMRASYLAKQADGKLAAYFGRLPRQPYGVEPVPDDLAPKYTAGRYVDAPLESKRGGTYWVNTYALDKRSLYTLPALTLHEAVPGHHLQGALSKELQGLPEFRRYLYVNAFGEGWALYTEWLGQEMGMYPDPYSNFGRLTYEMWRACRLVVDTGVHAFGWSRQQVLDYLAANTALSLHEVETETDRYISWPGQALSYKMGELKIRELRARAERELGPRFDLRAFHDAVLENGTVTLDVLEQQIDGWIARRRGA